MQGQGAKDMLIHTAPDGTETDGFKAGPARAMTEVAPVDAPDTVVHRRRGSARPDEDIRVASENYLDPILQRNGQDNFFFGRYLFNSVFVDGDGHASSRWSSTRWRPLRCRSTSSAGGSPSRS